MEGGKEGTMQHHLKELEKAATIKVLGQGNVFTLVQADVFVGPKRSLFQAPAPDRRLIVSEAISRRSDLDLPNQTLGLEIAAGRALKALAKKIYGNGKTVIRHRFMG